MTDWKPILRLVLLTLCLLLDSGTRTSMKTCIPAEVGTSTTIVCDVTKADLSLGNIEWMRRSTQTSTPDYLLARCDKSVCQVREPNRYKAGFYSDDSGNHYCLLTLANVTVDDNVEFHCVFRSFDSGQVIDNVCQLLVEEAFDVNHSPGTKGLVKKDVTKKETEGLSLEERVGAAIGAGIGILVVVLGLIAAIVGGRRRLCKLYHTGLPGELGGAEMSSGDNYQDNMLAYLHSSDSSRDNAQTFPRSSDNSRDSAFNYLPSMDGWETPPLEAYFRPARRSRLSLYTHSGVEDEEFYFDAGDGHSYVNTNTDDARIDSGTDIETSTDIIYESIKFQDSESSQQQQEEQGDGAPEPPLTHPPQTQNVNLRASHEHQHGQRKHSEVIEVQAIVHSELRPRHSELQPRHSSPRDVPGYLTVLPPIQEAGATAMQLSDSSPEGHGYSSARSAVGTSFEDDYLEPVVLTTDHYDAIDDDIDVDTDDYSK